MLSLPGIQMNGHHSSGNYEFERAYPRCLGRTVNLFDMNIGVSANRLLNDRLQRDGSPLSRSRSDGSRITLGHQTEGTMNVSEFKNSFSKRKSNTTPMEMLVAQGKSNEVESRQDPPNLVAKLMGLEALPHQEPNSAVLRNHSRGHPRSRSDIPMSCWEKQDEFFHYSDPNEYKVDCGIWQRSQKSPHVARCEENVNDRLMGLVRQNFIEAKRLSVNEELRQSKQFQDALEVLSSNKDLFLKCMQEPPCSMFSENLYSRQSDAHPPVTKRITILRPSKTNNNDFVEAGNKNGKKIEKGAFLHLTGLEKVQPGSSSPANFQYYESPTQPTRIVVLRPTRKKACDVKTVGSPNSEQPMMLHREGFFRHIEDDEDQESREVAKEATQQMHEKLDQHCKDGTLFSSVLLNGYAGDESSFNKSQHEYVDGHLSDSEAMSSVSRHSWDYVNRLSPHSTSPFAWPSYSPESSVCREAKKRLSERWVMMASNEIGQEQIHYRRSSSTLGEMLSFTETKQVPSHGEKGSSSQESKDSDFLLVSECKREEKMDNSPRNLVRSKSVPVSSEFGTRLNIGNSFSDEGKTVSFKEDIKERSAKSSFKGKVSSLFFSRAKKTGKEKSLVTDTKDEFYSFSGDIERTGSLRDKGSIHASPLLEPSSKASSSNPICMQMMSPENGLVTVSGSPGENLDRPSPISVLASPFEEDEHIEKRSPYYAKPEQGVESPLLSIGSHMIGKSPPIGSIARSLSWNDSFVNSASSHPTNKLLTSQETDEEEQECFFFVKELLSEAGLHGEVCSTSCMARWHSLQSPLDPSLRGKSNDFKDTKKLHDGKLKQKRAVQKLVFDCVNAALVDAEYDSHLNQRGNDFTVGGSASSTTTVLDEVWNRLKVWFSSEVRGESDDCVEVVGKVWSDHFRLEMDNLAKEVEGRLLEELMWEVVVEFTGKSLAKLSFI
ncbi:hypothetical protein C2S51_022745 [Perilla frutescens var. frutescens]|nr:hypothetical protein C2S51_022745 [Perilla frutescens var. frutescens]